MAEEESKEPNESTVKKDIILSDPLQIYAAIQRLARAKAKVAVLFEGDKDVFNTIITKLDYKSQLFAFDKLIPEVGNEVLKSGKQATFKGDVNGILIEFKLHPSLKYKPSSEEYITKFPGKLLYLQRRDAYRAPIPKTYEIYIQLRSSESSEEFKAKLNDISSSGFKAIFPKTNVAAKLKEIGTFDESTLIVGDESLDCIVEAKHAVFDEEQGYTWCGFHFGLLSGMKQRYVDQLTQRLQHEEQVRQEAKKKIAEQQKAESSS